MTIVHLPPSGVACIHEFRPTDPEAGHRWQVVVVRSDGRWEPRSNHFDSIAEAERQACELSELHGWTLAATPIPVGQWTRLEHEPGDELDDAPLDDFNDDIVAAPEAPPVRDRWDDPAAVIRRALELAGAAAVARAGIDAMEAGR